jgi:hypothetical protein
MQGHNPYKNQKRKHDFSLFLTELDLSDLYEWGHLKLLKVQSLLKRKKNDMALNFLIEIETGLEIAGKKPENSELKKRINDELLIPAQKKMIKLLIETSEFKKAGEIVDKLLKSGENDEGLLQLRERISFKIKKFIKYFFSIFKTLFYRSFKNAERDEV